VRFERQHHLGLDVGDDASDGGLDVEHVDVRECVRIVAPLMVLPPRIVKAEQHRRLQSEPFARELQLLHAKRAEIFDWTHGGMRFAGAAIGGADKRHADAAFAQVSEDAAVKNLIVWMGQYDEE
jgi:hypothetical protein